MARKKSILPFKAPDEPTAPSLYTLEVLLISGMMTQEFVEKNPVVSRTIQILGDQTLEDLHFAIFKAFGRDDEHLYEFQFGKMPHDRTAKRYTMWSPYSDPGFDPPAEFAEETRLLSLGLKLKAKFFYWFDFGDDWWHQITVTAIAPVPASGKFPKVISKVGKNPPQYPDFD